MAAAAAQAAAARAAVCVCANHLQHGAWRHGRRHGAPMACRSSRGEQRSGFTGCSVWLLLSVGSMGCSPCLARDAAVVQGMVVRLWAAGVALIRWTASSSTAQHSRQLPKRAACALPLAVAAAIPFAGRPRLCANGQTPDPAASLGCLRAPSQASLQVACPALRVMNVHGRRLGHMAPCGTPQPACPCRRRRRRSAGRLDSPLPCARSTSVQARLRSHGGLDEGGRQFGGRGELLLLSLHACCLRPAIALPPWAPLVSHPPPVPADHPTNPPECRWAACWAWRWACCTSCKRRS